MLYLVCTMLFVLCYLCVGILVAIATIKFSREMVISSDISTTGENFLSVVFIWPLCLLSLLSELIGNGVMFLDSKFIGKQVMSLDEKMSPETVAEKKTKSRS